MSAARGADSFRALDAELDISTSGLLCPLAYFDVARRYALAVLIAGLPEMAVASWCAMIAS
jgi:hypothetical protein